MNVRMKVDMSGSVNGIPYPNRGQVGEIPDVVGVKLCAAGLAEPADTDDTVEKAVDDRPVEKRRGRPPGSKNKPTEPAEG